MAPDLGRRLLAVGRELQLAAIFRRWCPRQARLPDRASLCSRGFRRDCTDGLPFASRATALVGRSARAEVRAPEAARPAPQVRRRGQHARLAARSAVRPSPKARERADCSPWRRQRERARAAARPRGAARGRRRAARVPRPSGAGSRKCSAAKASVSVRRKLARKAILPSPPPSSSKCSSVSAWLLEVLSAPMRCILRTFRRAYA